MSEQPESRLNPRQQLFLAYYLETWNAAESAKRAGYSERTAKQIGWNLLDHPAIQAELQAWRNEVRQQGIAVLERRVERLNTDWERMQTVIRERAAEHEGEAPGAGTGLLARSEKVIGAGDAAEHVVEWTVDAGLLRELRAHEEQAAKELGQWAEKREVSGPDGAPLVIGYTVIPPNGAAVDDDPPARPGGTDGGGAG
jgi:hypothetical protein